MSRNLDIGTAIPDFRAPDENGVEHSLSELQGDNALVLHLSRGEHCPRERQFHRELLRFHEWAAVAFTELVSVLPNTSTLPVRFPVVPVASVEFWRNRD